MSTPYDPGALADAERLVALRDSGLDAASDPVFETFARLVRRLLGVPVALVSLVDPHRQWFPGAQGLPQPWEAARETPLTHSFCRHVVTSGVPLVVEDARLDAVLCDNLAIRDLDVVAYAGMPLRDGDGLVLGSLCAIDGRPRVWTADQLDTLRDLADACAAELRSRISSARAEAARGEAARLYEVQRATAASLQSALLTRLPQPAGLALSAVYHPAVDGADVGGDWYDAFAVSGGTTVVAIGDVVGHDVLAAARMGEIRGMLRTLAYDRRDPPSVLLSRLDRALAGLGTGTLATAVLAALTRTAGGFRLTWSNAGHLNPLLLPADGPARFLDEPAAHGIMLGVRPGAARPDATLELGPGDAVVLYTDGLVERRDTDIDAALARLRRLATGVRPDRLCARLGGHAVGDDDAAVLVVHVT